MKTLRHTMASLLMLTAASFPLTGLGDELGEASISQADGRFVAHTEVMIALPVHKVRAILTDYRNLARLNPSIKTVDILARGAGGKVRMQVVSQSCVLFFCRGYRWVQDVITLPSGDIIARVDPARSDFRAGWTRYRLLPEAGKTRLVFDADLVGDFELPSGIGAWMVKRKLLDESYALARNVEEFGG
ncbi:MAG: SRPBCC family protein [Gammaproteobacteria bacterium]